MVLPITHYRLNFIMDSDSGYQFDSDIFPDYWWVLLHLMVQSNSLNHPESVRYDTGITN